MSKSSKTINETINGPKKELIPQFRTKFIMLGQASSHCTQTESLQDLQKQQFHCVGKHLVCPEK